MTTKTTINPHKHTAFNLAAGIAETSWAIGASLAAAWCAAPATLKGAPTRS